MNVSLRNSLPGMVLICCFGCRAALGAPDPGLVVAWGDNAFGQTNVPAGLSNVVSVAAGQYHSLALIGDGTVVAWGANAYSQTNVPAGLTNVTEIAGGSSFSLALKTDGTVVGWGRIFTGSVYTNVVVPGNLAGVKAIAGGGDHILALKTNGTVVAWGYNGYGQTSVPANATNVIAIAAGTDHSLALKADHTVVIWGEILGSTNYITAVLPAGLTNMAAISAGDYHSLALRTDSAVTAWGYNADGETNVPSGLTNVAAIAAGGFHNLAWLSNGTLRAWGLNKSGQTQIPSGLRDLSAIAAGGLHNLAITLAPSITSPPPATVALAPGAAADLTVAAVSGSPLAYQWVFNGSVIPGATAADLPLTNFDLAAAGAYSVVASNQFAATSAATTVRLTNSPVILVDGLDPGGGSVSRTNSSFINMTTTFGPNSSIFFTLDGSPPDFTSAPYLAAFTLTSNAIVRAIAYNSNLLDWAEAAPIQINLWPAYSITASTPGGGSLAFSPSPYSANNLFLSNTFVTLTATPSAGWSFLGWTGDRTDTTNVITFSMTGPVAVQAIFATTPSLSTNGSGQVALDPPNGPFAFGSTVQVSATPAAGSYFFGWAGGASGFANPLTLALTNALSITALFEVLKSNQVSLAVSPAGDGTVAVSPSQSIYAVGESVTLTAEPGTSSVFSAWGGGISSTTNPLTLILTSNTTLTATFVAAPTNPPVSAPPTLLAFNSTNGANPNGLVLAADGTLFGTTQFGGTNGNSGTVFRLNPDGLISTLHCFATNEGVNPQTGLVQRQYDGNLYGATPSDSGAAFRITTNGALTPIFLFGGANGSSPSTLIEGENGNFFGTTQSGDSNSGWGSVFQMTFNGRFTTLYTFGGGDDGAYPLAALVQGADGYFYGTTSEGGLNNAGTVFRIGLDGTLATLYSFTGGNDGYLPLGALIQDRNGDFFGTTAYGGAYGGQDQGYGTVFKITPGGALTTLASFAGLNGAYPQAGLVESPAGDLYGTTAQGGTSLGDPNSVNGEGYGTVFRISPSGTLATFVSFNGANGAYPQTPLVQSLDGSLFGTTARGGIYDCGTVFKLNPADLMPALRLACVGATLALRCEAVAGQIYQPQFKSNLRDPDWANLGSALTATNDTFILTDSIVPGTPQRFYRLLRLP